ncbi:MAG: [protein-PII] uridylyltransferase [Deltaproteobacteria bacterium]|nr:[protein-PII] uridylyltransferase [Deltaproteobacteria bacterium]
MDHGADFETLREALGHPDLSGEEAARAAADYLRRGQASIREAYAAGASGRTLLRLRTALIDRLLAAAWVRAGLEGPGKVLVAVGGYGRAELAPHSDVDFLVLLPEAEAEALGPAVERLLYLLWDGGLELGHSVRTLAECVSVADGDATARTALLECRHLAGDAEAYAVFEAAMLGEVHSQRVETYVKERLADWRARRERFGRTVYRLEPDLKLGRGGQRDLQTAMWIARVCHHVAGLSDLARHDLIEAVDRDSLASARDFLWRVRCGLHYRAGRRMDLLTFDAQEALALELGYQDETHQLAVEHFMRDTYLAAREVDRIARGIIERSTDALVPEAARPPREPLGPGLLRVGERLEFDREADVEHDPDLCLRAIAVADREALSLASRARDRLRTAARNIPEREWQQPARVALLRERVEAAEGAGTFLELLHETGLLAQLLPELGRVAGLWQHDLYHAYTVDVHSIFAATRYLRLRSGAREDARFGPLSRAVDRPFVLFLAVLLHDVGKGLGGGHSEKGAAMMPAVAARLGLAEREAADLEWLVRAHLLMSHLSQRRDLADPDLIDGFAAEVRNLSRLRMLTLLTHVDASTTGEAAWTEWKASLLWQLHERTAERLGAEEGGPELIDEARARLRAALGPGEAVEAFLASLPERYLLAVEPAAALRHRELLARLDEGEAAALELDADTGGRVETLTIAGRDREGLLADLSGLLAAHRRSILSAQVFSLDDGRVIDVFELEAHAPAPEPGLPGGVGPAVSADPLLPQELCRAVTEPGWGSEEARRRLSRSRLEQRPVPSVPVRIRVDNEVSSAHTVIDVFGPDRLGLLHAITAALHREGISVALARVATEAHRATDAFYVVAAGGRKITAPETIEALRKELAAAVRG